MTAAALTAVEVREGTPTWTDLTVPDLTAVEPFYARLFGWSFRDLGEDAGHYRLIEKEGTVVAGAVAEDRPAPDGRSRWIVYLATEDLRETLAAVEGAAGTVLLPARDVGGIGAAAVATSPAGDVVGWWQPLGPVGDADAETPAPSAGPPAGPPAAQTAAGASSGSRHGLPVWYELMSLNYDTHLSFYRQVSAWEPSPFTGEHLSARYTTNFPGEAATAGMLEATNYLPTGTISFWRVYFGVDDLETAIGVVQELGGRVLAGPVDSPHGPMAVVRDPQGAGFPILQLPTR